MLVLLIIVVVLSVVTSGVCSLTEAAFYAVPHGFLTHRAESGSKAARLLLRLKDNISQPISAILILNTVANTAGAAIAGWAAAEVFGSSIVILFSLMFTLAILYFSEIIPKYIGNLFCKPVALAVAYPLYFLILLFRPLILISDFISKMIRTSGDQLTVTTEEISSIAATGAEEGALDHFEGSVIANVIGLDKTLVRDVLTPRIVVQRLSADTLVGEVKDDINNWHFSRIPIHTPDQPDNLVGYVTQRDIFSALLREAYDKSLRDLARPLKVVPDLMRVDKLLLEMFSERELICAVVDEHGSLAGIITLEDIIEEIVGREIVDEYDSVSDLRTFAKLMGYSRKRSKRDRQGEETSGDS